LVSQLSQLGHGPDKALEPESDPVYSLAGQLLGLPLKELQELQILVDNVSRLLAFQTATEDMGAVEVGELELASGLDGVEAATLRRAKQQGFIDHKAQWCHRSDLRDILADATATLIEKGVLPEVIAYGKRELYAQRTGRVGFIQGVTFAGEAVADDMLLSLFKVMYTDLGKYKGPVGQNDLPEDFEQNGLPYFAAHGEYLAIINGQETVEEKKTEIIHAQREFAKLSQLDTDELAEAFEGAQDFADRNLKVWNGILAGLLINDPQLQRCRNLGLCRNVVLHRLEALEWQGAFDAGKQSVVEIVAAALTQ
jgi:hypothetical protein